MNVGEPVRVYDDFEEWFSEGEIIAVDGRSVDVDFYDWVQRFDVSDLTRRIILYADVIVAKSGAGTIISDFR